jgi:hypothetical protein
MRIISFDYEPEFGESHLVPICYPRLLGPRGDVIVRALADSGAYFSVFPIETAEDAGIKLPRRLNTTVHFGRSIIGGKQIVVDLAIREMRMRAEVTFVEGLPFPYALLGRMGIWDQFKQVVFIESRPDPCLQFRYKGRSAWRSQRS